MVTREPTPPTERQLEIHAFMLDFHEREMVWPTLREICNEFGFSSSNSAADVLHVLQRKGLVRHRPRCARGWIAIEVAR